jgi:uncharacterized protein (TIGR02145 family)
MTIGNYTVQKLLGQGGMATVYLANHKLLGNKVAIKILSEDYLSNKNIRGRFLFEAKNLASMNHQNIIKVTDLIDEQNYVAFVMEYVEGETLKDYIERKGPLNDVEIKNIFLQMLDAVGYVHEQKLIHRDIKPSNFMIAKNGIVKLLDFGIVKNTDNSISEYTQTGTLQNMGTPMYMSPEQIKSTKDVTVQSDIYSLGVVLWQMAMGKKPYDTGSLSTYDLNVKIVTEPLPKTNSSFNYIIEKATEKEFANRFKKCDLIKEAIIKSAPLINNHTINEKITDEKTEVYIRTDQPTKTIDCSQNGLVVINGKEVNVVKVRNTVWSVNNLDVDRYRNGDHLVQVNDLNTLRNIKTGAWCYYDFNSSNGTVYGKLYNWYAVNDQRKLAPEGFHIPSTYEWDELVGNLGGEFQAGGKLKEKEFWRWSLPNKGATNEIGFTALPGGGAEWGFDAINLEANWWTSTERDEEKAWIRCIDHNGPEINKYSLHKKCFYSVRCVLDENQKRNVVYKQIQSQRKSNNNQELTEIDNDIIKKIKGQDTKLDHSIPNIGSNKSNEIKVNINGNHKKNKTNNVFSLSKILLMGTFIAILASILYFTNKPKINSNNIETNLSKEEAQKLSWTEAIDSTYNSKNKTVAFENNTNETIYLAIGYNNNSRKESSGWYELKSKQTKHLILPESFIDNKIYWFGKSDYRNMTSASDEYFILYEQSDFLYYKYSDADYEKGASNYSGFIKLDLPNTGEAKCIISKLN